MNSYMSIYRLSPSYEHSTYVKSRVVNYLHEAIVLNFLGYSQWFVITNGHCFTMNTVYNRARKLGDDAVKVCLYITDKLTQG